MMELIMVETLGTLVFMPFRWPCTLLRRVLFSLSIFALHIPLADARSGGGHTSFSGHSSSGYGSSYGHTYGGPGYGGLPVFIGGGSSFGQILFLILILLALFFWVSNQRVKRTAGEDAASELLHYARTENLPPFDAETLRQFDPTFSVPAFLDFAYALFATIHKMRGQHQVSALSVYLSPSAISTYESLSPEVKEVKGILVSGLSLIHCAVEESTLQITLNFQANYTESLPGAGDQSYYAEEVWTLSKKKSVPSLLPQKLRQISCPACGAPPSFSDEGRCSACGSIITRGDFNWSLEQVITERHQTPPLLTSTVEEEGTDLPTVFSPNLIQAETHFAEIHPEFKFSQLQKRASEIYFAAQKAWTERNWEAVRPYESENIFQMHFYWISEYQKQGLINVLKDIRLDKIEAVKVEQDPFFESITARMYGSMIDYTIRESTQEIISGNVHDPREFTEYWTFIRSAKGTDAKKHDVGCPACGAPLKINQAGHCEYCQALVTSGDFDWVLSSIEQDEVYRG